MAVSELRSDLGLSSGGMEWKKAGLHRRRSQTAAHSLWKPQLTLQGDAKTELLFRTLHSWGKRTRF